MSIESYLFQVVTWHFCSYKIQNPTQYNMLIMSTSGTKTKQQTAQSQKDKNSNYWVGAILDLFQIHLQTIMYSIEATIKLARS